MVLCLSHTTRELFACYIALTLAAERWQQDLEVFIIYPDPRESKGAPIPPHKKLYIWPGQELKGCRRRGADRNHIENGCTYQVVRVVERSENEGEVVVKLAPSMIMEDTPVNEIKLSYFEASQLLRYNYAATVAGCQGLTFANKRVLLLETEHKFFCRRKLYVATSRCTDPALFHVPSLEAVNETKK